ncbi:MAG: DUF2783 domain-containing protein [Thiomonas sp.]
MELNLEPHFSDPGRPTPYSHLAADAFYAELLQAHEGLNPEQSAMLDAKLVLLLANHIGDLDVLRAALRAGREDLEPQRGEPCCAEQTAACEGR